MTKEDSFIFRAIAEVAMTGYQDQYGNFRSLAQDVINQWRPTEDFYKRLEKKIDVEAVAQRMEKTFGNISPYDRNRINEEIINRAKEIAAQKLAEEFIKKT